MEMRGRRGEGKEKKRGEKGNVRKESIREGLPYKFLKQIDAHGWTQLCTIDIFVDWLFCLVICWFYFTIYVTILWCCASTDCFYPVQKSAIRIIFLTKTMMIRNGYANDVSQFNALSHFSSRATFCATDPTGFGTAGTEYGRHRRFGQFER